MTQRERYVRDTNNATVTFETDLEATKRFLPVEDGFQARVESVVIPLGIIASGFHFNHGEREVARPAGKHQRISSRTQGFCQAVSGSGDTATDMVDFVSQGFQEAQDLFYRHPGRTVIVFQRNRASVGFAVAQRVAVKTNNQIAPAN
ncbi:hypothetical protein SDC9_210345 [bioreactor metagenome]|uniref:Uncharacterized protein n=1 Tax=bioreactor metagenome TaxID=1076179 RepID=A0A645JQU6_9ZZZZ